MSTSKVKISIPELCHEDWNKMTPNEKGSFCSKCCKTVVDFTQKSPEEIRDILLKNSDQKVCGRFLSNQLDEPGTADIHLKVPLNSLPAQLSPLRSFAIALFIAFGTTLFSCGTYNNAPLGEVQVDPVTFENEETDHTKVGEVSVEPVKNQEIEKDTLERKNTSPEMLGAVYIQPVCEPAKDTVKRNSPPSAPLKMGKVKVYKE